MVIHRIGIQMFKFNLGLSPVALNNLFVRNSNIHNYNTSNKNKLRSAIGRHKFIYKNYIILPMLLPRININSIDINLTFDLVLVLGSISK